MARTVLWTRRVLRRLDEIAAHIAAENPLRAASFVGELRAKLSVLALHLPDKPGRVYGTRELVLHRHYLAVYRVRGEEVHILTVLHTARQWP